MKILQVSPKYYPSIGGVEQHVRNISERLAELIVKAVATKVEGVKLRSWEEVAEKRTKVYEGPT